MTAEATAPGAAPIRSPATGSERRATTIAATAGTVLDALSLKPEGAGFEGIGAARLILAPALASTTGHAAAGAVDLLRVGADLPGGQTLADSDSTISSTSLTRR